jgi:hypothetical protein
MTNPLSPDQSTGSSWFVPPVVVPALLILMIIAFALYRAST